MNTTRENITTLDMSPEEALRRLQEQLSATAHQQDAATESDAHDDVYIIVEADDHVDARQNVSVENVDSDKPTVHIGNKSYQGTHHDDVRSTLVFDRKLLRHYVHYEEGGYAHSSATNMENPLVCVTTSRLQLEPLQ